MKRSRNKGIFALIVKNYMLSLFIMLISSLIIVLGVVNYTTKEIQDNKVMKVVASKLVRADYENIDISSIKDIGGWVEILDEKLDVIYVKGDKKDIIKHYTRDDIFNILDITKNNHDRYHGTIQQFKKDDRTYYCVVKIPLDSVKVNYSFINAPYKFMKAVYDPIIAGLILIIISIIINTIFYGRWTSKRIIKPLHKLMNGIKVMTSGNYSMRLDFKAEREYLLIRDAFNDMAGTIEKTQKEKKKLEASKMRLLADVSHDIKTPMTTIIGYIKALKDGIVKEKDKESCYETIYKKSQRVDQLINDMFDYVKLENVDYNVYKKENNFTEFLRQIVAEYYQQMEDKDFKVILNIPSEIINVSFDNHLMNSAIANILENVIKYNPKNTKVRIELYKKKDKVYLEIADDGVGIPQDVKEHLFDPFVRGDKVRKSDGGSGLGLAISKNIIVKHGGDISVSNGRKYEATMFRIKLDI
ncbi:HAMP domain-containing sensor histidine kinase [Clostridiaceae bacterium M8S5]|nr:HAMP domain-containing sensor histidine kinase [Clostridiaceae bacterium M8S5]